MKNIFISLLVITVALCFQLRGSAQDDCGTEFDEEYMQYLKSTIEVRKAFDPGTFYGYQGKRIPVRIHIGAKSDGTDGLTESDIKKAFETASNIFSEVGVSFFIYGMPHYIYDDKYYDFDKSTENDIYKNDLSKVLNVYFFNTVGGNGFCYKVTQSQNRILIKNGVASNGTTLSHELGHYLSLPHTFAYNTKTGIKETVTRDKNDLCYNCETEGDMFCDTHADPKRSDLVNNCSYIGQIVDTCESLPYNPPLNNLMSYYISCRTGFSQEQYNSIAYCATNERDYLFSCSGLSDELLINENLSGTQRFDALGKVEVKSIIISGNTTCTSGGSVYLKPGFKASSGSSFLALINGCDAVNKEPLLFGGNKDVILAMQSNSESISAAETLERIAVYPNPFSGVLTVELPGEAARDVELTLSDGSGSLVKKIGKRLASGRQRFEVNTEDLPAGPYFWRLRVGGKEYAGKVLKQ